jgi:hypothetical protein
MNSRFLVFGLLSILTAKTAAAAVYYDTVDVGANANANYDGYINNNPLMAASFTLSGMPSLSVTLALSADHTGDGGSLSVYLVPDDGNSSGTGVAADPLTLTDPGTGLSTSYDGAQLVTTIADSSLVTTATTPGLVTFSIPSATVSLVNGTSANQEYWIGLALGDNSSAEWWQNADGAGIGTTNQADFNTTNSPPGFATTGGAYEMIVADVPEPATIAVLGGALATLLYARRRRSNR